MLQEERSRGPWELGRKEGFLTLCGGVKEGFLEEESSRPRWEARQAEDRGVFQRVGMVWVDGSSPPTPPTTPKRVGAPPLP